MILSPLLTAIPDSRVNQGVGDIGEEGQGDNKKADEEGDGLH
jgi:hypothetical protein